MRSRLAFALILLLVALAWLVTPTGAQQIQMLGLWGTSTAGVAGTPVVNQMPTAVTLTARNVAGSLFTESSSRWMVVSAPAVSTQASASIAAEAGVRHVAATVCFSAGSTTAPALTNLTINLRDGATGAGTVIASFDVVIPAATGQNVTPYCTPSLTLPGTTNTAMTAEFSALLTNLFESVTLTGYNVGS